MIALLFRRLPSLLISRSGLLIIALSAAWAWHVFDKNEALRSARAGYVLRSELDAAKQQLRELQHRARIAEEAAGTFQEKLQVAQGEAARQAAELREYENANPIPESGRVSSDIFERLRGK